MIVIIVDGEIRLDVLFIRFTIVVADDDGKGLCQPKEMGKNEIRPERIHMIDTAAITIRLFIQRL